MSRKACPRALLNRSSLPGLTRQSIDLRKNFLAKKMDARVKPAHDELAKQLKLAPMGSSPRMTVESSGSIRADSAGAKRNML
jgi:hypothetical protein